MLRFLPSRVLGVGSAAGLLRFGWSIAGDEELEETSHPPTIVKTTLTASKFPKKLVNTHDLTCNLLDTKLLSIKPLYNTLFGDDFHAKQSNGFHKEPTMLATSQSRDDYARNHVNDVYDPNKPYSGSDYLMLFVMFGLPLYGLYKFFSSIAENENNLYLQLHSMFDTPEFQEAFKDIKDDGTFQQMMTDKDIKIVIVQNWMQLGYAYTYDPESKQGGPFLCVSSLLNQMGWKDVAGHFHDGSKYESSNWTRALVDFLKNHANITNDRITFYDWIRFHHKYFNGELNVDDGYGNKD